MRCQYHADDPCYHRKIPSVLSSGKYISGSTSGLITTQSSCTYTIVRYTSCLKSRYCKCRHLLSKKQICCVSRGSKRSILVENRDLPARHYTSNLTLHQLPCAGVLEYKRKGAPMRSQACSSLANPTRWPCGVELIAPTHPCFVICM